VVVRDETTRPMVLSDEQVYDIEMEDYKAKKKLQAVSWCHMNYDCQ
jgi:hypothetical protein